MSAEARSVFSFCALSPNLDACQLHTSTLCSGVRDPALCASSVSYQHGAREQGSAGAIRSGQPQLHRNLKGLQITSKGEKHSCNQRYETTQCWLRLHAQLTDRVVGDSCRQGAARRAAVQPSFANTKGAKLYRFWKERGHVWGRGGIRQGGDDAR